MEQNAAWHLWAIFEFRKKVYNSAHYPPPKAAPTTATPPTHNTHRPPNRKLFISRCNKNTLMDNFYSEILEKYKEKCTLKHTF